MMCCSFCHQDFFMSEMFAETKQLCKKQTRSASIISFSWGESTEKAQCFCKSWGLSSRKAVGGSSRVRAAVGRLHMQEVS